MKVTLSTNDSFISYANPSLTHTFNHTQLYLYQLLTALDGVQQHPKYHPEEDALYHSLQVFQLALNETDDPELLAAALFHDIGKAVDSNRHAQIGYDYLDGILTQRICWLIAHHLDLLTHPKRTRRRLPATQLRDLERLRKWDINGRKTDAFVMSPEMAIDHFSTLIPKIS